MFGINTNRGAAVRTLVKCLVQRQPPQIERAFALLEQAATDPSTAVRVCVIDALIHLLKYDRERAFAIFVKTMEGQPRLLESAVVHNFLY